MPNNDAAARVLSIQSHVVHGYVGNRCATFPLQLLGFDVDVVNSVQLSNHVGYATTHGKALDAKQLAELFRGLRDNRLDSYSHLLTGYCRSADLLRQLATIIDDLKARNAQLLYYCDPVLGDHGSYYVPQELMPIYRDEILPRADVITPNQFEASRLTGIDIQSESDAARAIDALHRLGVETVVISSSDLGKPNQLLVFGSVNGQQRVRCVIKRLPLNFVGTGDLFSALLMAWLHRSCGDLASALEKALSATQAVLRRTLEHVESQRAQGASSINDVELRLVQSKEDLEEPPLDLVRVEEWHE